MLSGFAAPAQRLTEYQQTLRRMADSSPAADGRFELEEALEVTLLLRCV